MLLSIPANPKSTVVGGSINLAKDSLASEENSSSTTSSEGLTISSCSATSTELSLQLIGTSASPDLAQAKNKTT